MQYDATNPFVGQYGAAEQSMGQDMYQAVVAHQKMLTTAVEQHTKSQSDTTTLWRAGVGFLLVFGVMAMLPVLVWLWRWAVS